MVPINSEKPPTGRTTRLRFVVLAVAVVATAVKLLIAARTFGTNDVRSWLSFSEGVRTWGPVDMYGHAFSSLYNHPPLSGRMLVAINWMVDHDLGTFTFLIKVPAVLADLVMALLVFELVRLRCSAGQAAAAGVLVVCSPALAVVSGFHGNTDPLFVMLAVLSVYLLVVPRWAAAAGVAFALSLSVKLTPVVLAPLLLVLALRLGWRRLLTFAGGGAVVFGLLWLPVVLRRWPEFSRDVLGYQGIWPREWGLSQLAKWVHASTGVTEWFAGPGRFVVLLIAGLLPAVIAWRRPATFAPAAAGLAMAMFLLLSPAFGMQYLVWPLAAAYFVSFWAATAYNAAVSVWVLSAYSYWNDDVPPWDWFEGKGRVFRPEDTVLMVISWVALAAVVAVGLSMLRGHDEFLPSGAPRAPAEPGKEDNSEHAGPSLSRK
ncbi:MAG: glycosyltransferase 87 family protein [Actinophytocola sp.]|uniref:glycosyltransferase 87 family protein n=1 Tax=Actinophytocola sp. TaxID=1872138 RepID=UPI003C79302F